MSKIHKPMFVPANEDTIQCFFYLPTIGSDPGYSDALEDLCKQFNILIQSLTKDYIWHRDEFQIFIPIEEEIDVPHLSSITCFGDNIEDEWFIVYIIFELTKSYENLIVQVKDNDGDFLLIEAADKLPTWANPDTTENRVYIYNGHIHILPPEIVSLQSQLQLKNVLKIIIQSPEKTQASSDIEKTILNRIEKYSKNTLENTHKALARVPVSLAALLTLKPNLIAPIVDSYCSHDILDEKCCNNINLDDCVTVEVKFTKFLYAMLANSALIPHLKCKAVGSDKESILGLKLLCGYQIIMSKTSTTDLFASKEYNQFLNRLKKNGYFKNNIEGSKDYKELLKKANNYYCSIESPLCLNISQTILELISSYEYTKLKDELAGSSTVQSSNCSNTEDWLEINPDQLNDLLYTWYGKETNLKKNDIISPETVTTELSHFLKQNSDFEGIETGLCNPSGEVEFEPDDFIASVEKMLSILSTGSNGHHTHSNESSSDDDGEDISSYSEDECDKELKSKLYTDQEENLQHGDSVLQNLVQSLKEEQAFAGPSSNVLGSAGIRKIDLLDSDDDLE